MTLRTLFFVGGIFVGLVVLVSIVGGRSADRSNGIPGSRVVTYAGEGLEDAHGYAARVASITYENEQRGTQQEHEARLP